MEAKNGHFKVLCIGAGPAGLTLAHSLTQAGLNEVLIVEADSKYVGGIARTVEYKGFRFDIGGHRFFSKSSQINSMWREILGDELLVRPRSSKILYNNKYYSYPLKPLEALLNLGFTQTFLCVASYFYAQIRPLKNVTSFQDWMINHFGRRFFSIFFKTYTEKVWGMRCTEISADWAQKRIKDLSLMKAVLSALTPKVWRRRNQVKSLIEEFYYPRLGPGMLWERTAQIVQARGAQLLMGYKIIRAEKLNTGVYEVTAQNCGGETLKMTTQHLVSTCPLHELITNIIGDVPETIKAKARQLRYRDFITVALIVEHRQGKSPIENENWVYIHDTRVRVARIQNFKKWSSDLVPDEIKHCYGLEYFVNVEDSAWQRPDSDWIMQAKAEFLNLGLANADEIIDATVIRQPKAYPVYDADYKEHVENIKQFLDAHHPHLQVIGRNGMHRYNNQDHSMMTAHLAAQNILSNYKKYNVWSVDQDADYHEAEQSSSTNVSAGGLRQVPEFISTRKNVTSQPEL